MKTLITLVLALACILPCVADTYYVKKAINVQIQCNKCNGWEPLRQNQVVQSSDKLMIDSTGTVVIGDSIGRTYQSLTTGLTTVYQVKREAANQSHSPIRVYNADVKATYQTSTHSVDTYEIRGASLRNELIDNDTIFTYVTSLAAAFAHSDSLNYSDQVVVEKQFIGDEFYLRFSNASFVPYYINVLLIDTKNRHMSLLFQSPNGEFSSVLLPEHKTTEFPHATMVQLDHIKIVAFGSRRPFSAPALQNRIQWESIGENHNIPFDLLVFQVM